MTLTTPPRLLLVHAHPDDESLWTGGTIARYASAGVHVTVVTCTLGEEGEIIPEFLRELGAEAADQLGGFRVGELRGACAALGVSDHRFLGGIGRWRDSGMAGTAANRHPRAFAAGELYDQVKALETILAEIRPQVVVTYGPDGGYGHPDHIRAHDVTMAACSAMPEVERVFYAVVSAKEVAAGVAALASLADLPFRLPQPGELHVVDDALITCRVPITEALPAKIGALRAHGTQVSVWNDTCYALSNGIAQPVLPAEYYILARGNPNGAEVDLFGDLGDPR